MKKDRYTMHEEAGITILIITKLDFRIKSVPRDEQGHYLMVKRSSHQEDMYVQSSVVSHIHI